MNNILIGLILIFILLLLYLIYQLLDKKKSVHITIKILTVLYVAIFSTPILLDFFNTYYYSPPTLEDIFIILWFVITLCAPLTLAYLIYFTLKIFKRKDNSKKMIIGFTICILLLIASILLVFNIPNMIDFTIM